MIRELLLQVLCSAALWALATAQTSRSARWCAEPRPDEPLLHDAQELRDPENSDWATRRYAFEIPPIAADAEIAVIRDEASCRVGAEAYAVHMRGIFGESWPAKPVLVVRVGDMYLADDQGSREGKHAVWTALLFDKAWRTLLEYGAGS